MSEQILVPVLGESINEATVSKWLKNEGDFVNEDEAIVELETDKVNLEVPAHISGILKEIKYKDGETVEVGSVLGLISATTKELAVKSESIEEEKTKNDIENDKSNIIKLDVEQKTDNKDKEEHPLLLNDVIDDQNKDDVLILTNEVVEKQSIKNEAVLSPAVRKIVVENQIDTSKVQGSGKDGRILKGDLLSLMGENPSPNSRRAQYGEEERIKMTRLRQTIAKRLKEAQNNAAMLTTFNEVDMSGIISMRKENQEDFQSRYGIKLGFMSFFVKACIVSLKLFPAINAEVENQEIIYKNYYNISFAVGTEKGLVVPVLKNADEMSFPEIEKEIKRLSDKAKEGTLTIEDLQGGTFTISNGGVYGSMLSTPILNPPQSGVLGMHNIVKRPVADNGEIKIKPVMYLALSYDHRIIDGKDSVSFLKTVKENLEDPRRLFLNI
ncbi:MAG: dihydrolipoyllysine-residue succinyltransferase [Candidatus Pelagibacter sp.]|nr:dihydrolipoyllysine-residue succinyltransferase [Candidatus Pelagibacter sp.]